MQLFDPVVYTSHSQAERVASLEAQLTEARATTVTEAQNAASLEKVCASICGRVCLSARVCVCA